MCVKSQMLSTFSSNRAMAENIFQSFLLIPTMVAKGVGIYLSFYEKDLGEKFIPEG